MSPARLFRAGALILVGSAVGCGVDPLPTDTGVPWELAEHRRATLTALRYRIELDLPEDRTAPIQGRSVLSFELSDPDAQPVVIDFMSPGERVRRVAVNGREVEWEAVNDHVVVPWPGDGPHEIELEYAAGDEAFNRNEEFLYALFVPDRAHFSLPVFDQPNLKAPVTWVVTAPESWSVVANGPLSEAVSADGRTTHTFLETRPIPTYLFAIAAGLFEEAAQEIGGRTYRMYHRETDTASVARNTDEIFRLHTGAVEWLEEYTGIAYPFQKFAFVLIPSFQYGGMEHPGGILYRQGGLMLDETATQGQILGRASVIAHETAHMWFGDLVTMNWFDDVWTKEVFANFMAAKIVNPAFPELDHELRFLTAHHPSAYGVDRTEGANPIRQPLENLRFAGTLYGAIIYQKAPIVMRHLETRVGEETFRDGMRDYLRRFSYGNATWPDLIEILDARSPEDLTAWSRVWVEEPDRPTITVVREGTDVVISQTDRKARGRTWPQTLNVRLGDVSSSELVTLELGAEPARLEGAAGAAYVLPNGTGLEYGGFVLDEASSAYLLANVERLQPSLLRGAAWVTLWDQVLEARTDPEAFLAAVLRALPEEEDELVLGRVLSYASTAFWRLLSDAQRAEWAPAIEALLWDEVQSARPRTARASFYSSYRGMAVTAQGVERLRRIWSGDEAVEGLPLSESDEISLASTLALRGVPDADSILGVQEGRIRNPDRLERFRFVRPSLSVDAADREAFFRSLADPARREREPWVLSGLNNVHHPLRARSALPLVRPALDLLDEIQRTGDIFFPGRWLGAVLGGHGSPEAAETVRTYLAESPELSPRLRLKVLQSADMVFRAARIVYGEDGS